MSGYLDWQAGDRVVCVDGQWSDLAPLRKGGIYTLRSVYTCPLSGDIGVRLDGVINQIHPAAGIEYGYRASRFRKVQPRKTNIAIFTAMLHDNKEHVPG